MKRFVSILLFVVFLFGFAVKADARKSPARHSETCLNSELLKSGLAWWHKEGAPKETRLQQLEASARLAKSGLWEDENPVAPWDFRSPKEN